MTGWKEAKARGKEGLEFGGKEGEEKKGKEG